MCQGTHKQTGGHEVPTASTSGTTDLLLGGEAPGVPGGGVRTGAPKLDRRLAESRKGGRGRVETAPGRVPQPKPALGPHRSRPVCVPPELPVAAFLQQGSLPWVGGGGRPPQGVAEGPAVRVSPHQANSKGGGEVKGRKGGVSVNRPLLAPKAMVLGTEGAFSLSPAGSLTPPGPPEPGPSLSSSPVVPPSLSLEVEREHLTALGYPPPVIDTLLACRKPSTNRLYNSTWSALVKWCRANKALPTRLSVSQLLGFLQQGLDKGLSTSTLRRQVFAVAAVLGHDRGTKLSHHPHVKQFLRGVSLLNPPPVVRAPSWDLGLVLQALSKPPFEPLASCPIRELTLKVAFLIAVVSARRVSELAALSMAPHCVTKHSDRVVLRLDPSFIPKVNSPFHREAEVILPSFYRKPSSAQERDWHHLDVRRAFLFYVDRTAEFRHSEALFLLFQRNRKGCKASPSTIAKWIRQTIALSYSVLGLIPPKGILAHSTRGAAASAAFRACHSLEMVCRAATWSSPNTFIRHYKVDKFASRGLEFGRSVLQSVSSSQGSALP